MDFDQKWSTIFYNNLTLRPRSSSTLSHLQMVSCVKSLTMSQGSHVYSLYLLNFEQIELIGCVIKLCRKFLGMCQTIGCAQFLKLVSACSSRGGGGNNLSGKANFLLHLIMIHLVTEILERPVSEEADVKVMQFHSRRGQII